MSPDAVAGARITNADLSQIFSRTDTRLCLIEETVGRIDKALNGNGRPGLIEDHRALQHLVEGHIEQAKLDTDARTLLARETKEAKELLATEAKTSRDNLALDVKAQREKMSARTWAVVFAVISVVITQTAGLVVLFIRTGGIR